MLTHGFFSSTRRWRSLNDLGTDPVKRESAADQRGECNADQRPDMATGLFLNIGVGRCHGKVLLVACS
jgi:hypothetical protein